MNLRPDPPMASKENKAADATRRQILDAAAKLFRKQGFKGTTMRQIAEAAQMKAGSLYYHFSSKDEVLAEVFVIGIQLVFDEVKSAVSALGSSASFRKRIETGAQIHMEALHRYGDFTSANIRNAGQAPETVKGLDEQIRKAYARYWAQLVLKARQAGEIRQDLDPFTLRMTILGALNWSLEWFDPDRFSTERFAKDVVEIIFDGASA